MDKNIDQKKSNSKIWVIVLILLSLTLIGGGFYLVLTTADNSENNSEVEVVDKEEVRNLIDLAVANINDLNSYVVDYNMHSSLIVEGEEQSISMSGGLDVDYSSEINHMWLSMFMLGQEMEMESYTVVEEGITYTYTTDFINGWSKAEGESSTSINTNEMVALIDSNEFEVVKEDDIYTVTLMVDASQIDTTGNPDLEGVKIPYVFTIENEYITSIVVNLEEADYILGIEIYYSRFNEDLELEVPVEALNS